MIMKSASTRTSRHHQRREACLRQLAQVGVFVEGSLCKVTRPGRKAASWQLTHKQDGKTRTVYVPLELVPEVQQWVKEYRHLKQLMQRLSHQSLRIIQRHVGVRRAAQRGQRLIAEASADN